MQRNVGTAERLVRIIIGVVLLALTVVGPRTWWGLVGLVPLGDRTLGLVTRLERVEDLNASSAIGIGPLRLFIAWPRTWLPSSWGRAAATGQEVSHDGS